MPIPVSVSPIAKNGRRFLLDGHKSLRPTSENLDAFFVDRLTEMGIRIEMNEMNDSFTLFNSMPIPFSVSRLAKNTWRFSLDGHKSLRPTSENLDAFFGERLTETRIGIGMNEVNHVNHEVDFIVPKSTIPDAT